MKSKSLLLSTLTALTLAATPALAQMDHSMHGTPASSTTSMSHGMNDMGGLAGLSGKAFDRAYLSMMIAHHQGAVDMARAVQGRVKDAQVKTWVANVIRDQTREISDMSTWLKPLGGVNTGMRDMMASGMKGMVTPLKTAKNPDVAFVQGMLPHHASALDMANLALQKSSDPRVLKLSRDIIKAQADEMYTYRQWLARRG
ncbi:hypothetical protein DEIPH_ctg046orf0047 [Deinococcus phoenicis]|uniref:DUF305 domain-containing protein n=1 Tax=Deinococcus phoenicis TaxID=1476583 RepID=A0A016QM67_9DEIO|nr:DUF305 domain-containing protein [Deinococcus phoenicis]EYB67245.1 hypothetical protein DEIPH_ctg046orf0047 [Deinococcus phoenicis]